MESYSFTSEPVVAVIKLQFFNTAGGVYER